MKITAELRRRSGVVRRTRREPVAVSEARAGRIVYVATYGGGVCRRVVRRVVTERTGMAVCTLPPGRFAVVDGWPIGPAVRRVEPPAPVVIGPMPQRDRLGEALTLIVAAEPLRLAPGESIRAIDPDTRDAQDAGIRATHSREIRDAARRARSRHIGRSVAA